LQQDKKFREILFKKNNELNELRNEINKLNIKIFNMKNTFEIKANENSNLLEEINELKAQIDSLKQNKVKFENFFNAPDGIESIKSLKQTKESLEKELREKENKINILEKNNKTLERETVYFKGIIN